MRNSFFVTNGKGDSYGLKKSVLDNFGREVSDSRDAVNEIVKKQRQESFPDPPPQAEPKNC